MKWKINTSNPDKLREFQQLFAAHGHQLTSTQQDIPEIQADPITIIAHKASQMDDFVLVEDTSLDVEGTAIGAQIKWCLDHLNELIGRKATWTVLLAYKKGESIFIFKGSVSGTIVSPSQKKGFGFDPHFLPDGELNTLADSKPNRVNARALAVEALLKNRIHQIVKPISTWNGPWQ